MTPYQFTILRYVHNAAAEEFVNIGVVMLVPSERLLMHTVNERYGRLSRFFGELDGPAYRQMARALASALDQTSAALAEVRESSAVPSINLRSVLDSVIPPDASCFQASEVMAGVVRDPRSRLQQLFREFVERYEGAGPRQRRDEAGIWTSIDARLTTRGLWSRLQTDVSLEGGNFEYRFKAGWMNGAVQVLEPISLDYLDAALVVDKANTWSGRLFNLAKGAPFQFTGVVAPPARTDLSDAYERAMSILRSATNVRKVIEERDLDQFLPEIERDLDSHAN